MFGARGLRNIWNLDLYLRDHNAGVPVSDSGGPVTGYVEFDPVTKELTFHDAEEGELETAAESS